MVVPFTGDGGLGRGGGGELCRDLLVHLRNGQAVGAHLVAVHLQDDGGIAAAKAVVRIGKASVSLTISITFSETVVSVSGSLP